MLNLRSWRHLFLAGLMLLLLVALPACVCADSLEQLINELIVELERVLLEWWNNFITDLQREISKWWNNLVERINQQLNDWWADLQQEWNDFWLPFHPPAPVIIIPTDGLVSESAAINMRGTGLAGSILTIWRDGKHFRDVTINEVGEWEMKGVVLNKGENIFTATVSKILFISSPTSNSIHVTFPGGELASVPLMSPAIDSVLDPPAWMVELALEQLKANDNSFYEARRAAFSAALRAGLQASQDDDEAHRFINLDVPLTFDEYLLVFLVPKDIPTDQILEAFSKAVESAVLDKAVRQELMQQITESFERMNLTKVMEEGGKSFSFEYIRIELERTYLLEHFDPRALAKFRTRLGTQLTTGLLSEATGGLVEQVVRMNFALWGRADADSQVQHYYDLAIRAWSHRDIDGALLQWDDPANNAFDGDMGYVFATNEEWAMFYLGRAAFYLQSPADPYYTIPYYKPEADLWAFLARKGATTLAEKLIQKKAEAVLGKVVGGARPITQIFVTKEILEWMVGFLRYTDAREVRDVHRPYFAEFTAGHYFDYPIPEERKQAGALNDRAGYAFRGPNDLILHDYLQNLPFSLSERIEHPQTNFAVQPLLETKAQELALDQWTGKELRQVARHIAQRAAQYVHPGRIGQTDKRIPEGDMIVDNPYLIREVYGYQFVETIDSPVPSQFWQAREGDRLRLVLLDGTVIEGRVAASSPVQPMDRLYHNSQTLIENEVWVYLVSLNELSYIAGTMDSFPYSNADLIAVEGDLHHLYVVFDWFRSSALEIEPGNQSDLMYYLIGMAGNSGSTGDLPEKDGAARIAADRLIIGTLATQHLLTRFAIQVETYQPPQPIVVGPGDFAASLGSPGELHLYDRAGHHIGLNQTGDVEVEVIGSCYFTSSETGQQFIVIPHVDLEQDYTLRVNGIDNGTFDLDLFYTDRNRREAIRLTYDDVFINSTTVAELTVQPDDPHLLRVDEDGNGSFERELPPSYIIETTVIEFDRTTGLPISIIIGAVLLGISLGGATWVVLHRRRQRYSTLIPTVLALPTCPHCGAIARRSETRFCARCGRTLATAQTPLKCPRCGTIARRPGTHFCPRCGGPM